MSDNDMVALTTLIDTFLSGRNPHTLAAYRHDVHDFARFVGADTPGTAVTILLTRGSDMANALVLAYKQSLIDRGLAAATVNRRLATLRNLVFLAGTTGVVSWELTIVNQAIRISHDMPEPGAGAVAAVFAMLENHGTPVAIRDCAIIHLLYDLALQRAEVVSLDREHVASDISALAVPSQDNSGREPVAFSKPTKEALRAWLAVRGDRPGPLFTNFDHGRKGDGRLTDRNLYAMVRRHGEAVGVYLRPHALRSAAITAALTRSDGDAAAVQRFSRHKTIAAVRTYNTRRMDRAGEIAR